MCKAVMRCVMTCKKKPPACEQEEVLCGGVETTVQAIATGAGDMAFPIDFSM